MSSVVHGASIGHKVTSEYGTWSDMKQRCSNPRHRKYHRYGGRGIVVCERWQCFKNFFADMGRRPSIRHSLDRIDNNGNYEPGNCRWATTKQQARNTVSNQLVSFQGETLCLAEWAERKGIKPLTLRARIFEYGWTVERAMTTPVRE